MGTRGAVGFKFDQKEVIFYNHLDSHPDSLGRDVVNYVRSVTDWNEIREKVVAFEPIEEGATPTQEHKDRARFFGTTDLRVSTKSENDFYCLTRGAQGNIELQLSLGFGELYNEFLYQSLHCEYAYVINLDTLELEFYEGFNEDREADGRYAKGEDEGFERNGYAGVRLVGEAPLNEIPDNWEELFYPEGEE